MKKNEQVKEGSDPINHPDHYNFGSIEVIEAIEDWELFYHTGNAIKYIARAGRKNPATEVQDLQKAIWYLNRRIEVIGSNRKNERPKKPNKTSVATYNG